jgi:hypothetical protein
MTTITYEEIDNAIATLDAESLNPKTLLTSPGDVVTKLLRIYPAVRPLIASFALIPVLRAEWRTGIQLFIAALDALEAERSTPDFKAGKDL